MSGSANHHHSLSPSAAERWGSCTAQPAFEAENPEKILIYNLEHTFPELIHYMRTELPDEEWNEDELEYVPVVESLMKGQSSVAKLKKKQLQGCLRIIGSVPARTGTRAHDFAEQILNGEVALDEIPEQFQEGVGQYVAKCEQVMEDSEDSEPFVELRVPLFYDKKGKGTLDFGLATPELIEIVDYKNGSGKFVSAEENPQLGAYAVSFAEYLEDEGLYDFGPATVVRMTIVQPNHQQGPPVRTSETTLADLRSMTKFLDKAAKKIHKGKTKFKGSPEACYFCPCRPFCEHRITQATAAFPQLLEDEVLEAFPDLSTRGATPKFDKKTPEERIAAHGLNTLSLKRMVKLWKHRKQVEKAYADMDAYLTAEAKFGEMPPGLKLVMGREGNTAWKNEDDADTFLKNQKVTVEERRKSSVITPTAVKTMFKDKLNEKRPEYSKRFADKFEDLTTRSSAKEVITLEEDSREPVSNVLDMFPDRDKDAPEPEDIP